MNDYPELGQIEDALVGAAARLAPRPRRRPAFMAALGAAALVALAGAAVAGAAGAGPLAGQLQGIFGADAADDVDAVTVRAGGHDDAATVADSAFFAALPSQEIASHPITVTARLRDGSTRVQHVPGLPVPIRRP